MCLAPLFSSLNVLFVDSRVLEWRQQQPPSSLGRRKGRHRLLILRLPFHILARHPLRHDDIDQLVPVRALLVRTIFRYLKPSYELIFQRPSSDLRNFSANEPSMWVKIVSSWLCIAIYIWTCIAPAILRDRDFS